MRSREHTTGRWPALSVVLLATTLVALGAFALREPVDRALLLQFGIAILTLNLLDVWLPHGDALDVDLALVVACAVQVGVIPAAVLSLATRTVSHFARDRSREGVDLPWSLARRSMSLLLLAGLQQIVGPISRPDSDFYYAFVLSAAILYSLTDLLLSQVRIVAATRRSLAQAFRGSLRLQGPIVAAEVSLAVLVLILSDDMGVWGIVLALVLLVVMRQSLVLLLDIRRAYRATIETFAAAMQAQHPETRDRATDVAQTATEIGLEYGLYGEQLEWLGYAALLHEVELIVLDETDGESPERRPADYLGEVRFLSPVLPVLRLLAGDLEMRKASTKTLVLAAIVALAAPEPTHGGDVTEIALAVSPRVRKRLRAAVESVLGPERAASMGV